MSTSAATAEKLLGADLQAIGHEAAKRRFAPLKEVVDRALQQLHSAVKDGAKGDGSAFAASTADHVWYAFAMAARAFSGNPALVANACHSLGKAAGLGLVPPAQVPMASQMLAELVVAPSSASASHAGQPTTATITNSSDVELRVLQAVAQLSSVVEGHPALQQEPLSLLFHLHARSPHASVRSAARAAVVQISDVILQWLVVADPAAAAGARSAHDLPSILAQRMAAARLFRDCCSMATGRSMDWLLRTAQINVGESAASLPLDILQTFLSKCPPAVDDAVSSTPTSSQTTTAPNAAVGSSPAAVFSRCINDSVLDLLANGPTCLAHTQSIDESDHQRAEHFAKIHRLIVTAVTRHIAACEIVTLRSVLQFHARFIASGGRYHPSSAKNTVSSADEIDTPIALGTEDCIATVVAAWRKAFAAPEFLQKLALAEAVGTQDVATLLSSVGDDDDGRINPLGHHRTQSNSSESSRDLSATMMDADEDYERKQQRDAALAAAWQSTSCVKLLEAAPSLLETALLALQQQRQMQQHRNASPVKPKEQHHDPSHLGTTTASAVSAAEQLVTTPLIGVLMDFNTMLTQSLARWFEQVVRQRPLSQRSDLNIGHRRALALVGHTYGAVWAPVYSCCSLALGLIDTEETLHSVLKVLTHLAHCATMARDSQSRDAVLRLLSDHAAKSGVMYLQASQSVASKLRSLRRDSNGVDVSSTEDVTTASTTQTPAAYLQRDIHVVSAIVSIANAVGDALEDGWYIVVESILAAHDRLTAIVTADPKFPLVQDVESIRTAIASLFDTATKRYPPTALRIMAQCLANTGSENDLPPIVLTELQVKQMISVFTPASIANDSSPVDSGSPLVSPSGRGSSAALRNGSTLSDPMKRTLSVARFISKAFAGMINATVPPASAGSGADVTFACATVAVHIWPFLRVFVFRSCSTPGYNADLIAQILSTLGDVISTTAANFATTDGHTSDPRTVVVDAALHLFVETYVRSDTFFSANADCSPSEARTALLKETVRIAQTRSHALRTRESWRCIFRIVEHATTTSALDAASGYRILELVRGNAVTQIADSETLNAFIGCVGKCICQSAAPDKIALNLSAVQLLWSMADFAAATKDEESGTSLVWNRLLIQLRDGAEDERVEIKHSCLKSLFSLLISHSQQLPKLSWPVVCWQIMLSLLERHVIQGSQGVSSSLSKQADDVKQTVIEGVSRVFRMYHVVIGNSVADATVVVERIFAALYKCVLGGHAETVTFAAVKAVGGILVDLSAYPYLLSLAAIDTAYLTFEQLVVTANKPAPVGAVVSLNSLKSMIENCVDSLAAARTRPLGATSWTETSEETHFHRIIALLETVVSAHSVVSTFMFPCSVHHALMAGIAKLCTMVSESARHTAGFQATAWDGLHRLVLSLFPTVDVVLEAVESKKGLPRKYHPQYIASLVDFVANTFVPLQPSWNTFLNFAKQITRCLFATALVGFLLPNTVPTALHTASIRDSGRAKLVSQDYLEAHEGKLTLLCISRIALLWSLASCVGQSTAEAEESITSIYYSAEDQAVASPASPQRPLPRQPLTKLLGSRAKALSDTKPLALVATSIAQGVQLHLDRAAATKCDAIHVTVIIAELLVPVAKHCEELSWGSVLSEEGSLLCIEALLTAAVKLSSCGPNDCPAATHHASAFLLDFDSRCNEAATQNNSNASTTRARIGSAAVSALNTRASTIIDMVQAGDAAQVAAYRRPLLDVLSWLALQPPNNAVSRSRLTLLAPRVVMLIGAPTIVGDAELLLGIRQATMAAVALLALPGEA